MWLKKKILKVQALLCCKKSQRGSGAARLNRQLLLRYQEKKRIYDLWKKDQATQEEYRYVTRVCRGKTNESLIWPTLLKIIKNDFTNMLTARGGSRRIFHIYWMR